MPLVMKANDDWSKCAQNYLSKIILRCAMGLIAFLRHEEEHDDGGGQELFAPSILYVFLANGCDFSSEKNELPRLSGGSPLGQLAS